MATNGERASRPRDTLRRAAFGDGVAPEVHVLMRRAVPAPQRWLAAVVLGAQGRYAAAAALLDELRTHHDPVLASLAMSTFAAHRRQLGGHMAARGLDGAALARCPDPAGGARWHRPGHLPATGDPDGLDAAGAARDALLGLAADALGLGRTGQARVLLGRAGPGLAWRGRVRWHWVRAEVELAEGRPLEARAHAGQAACMSRHAGADRHVTKSDLMLAATLVAAGREADRARRYAVTAGARALDLRLRSLAWPAGLLAESLGSALAEPASEILRSVLLESDPRGRELALASAWVPTEP